MIYIYSKDSVSDWIHDLIVMNYYTELGRKGSMQVSKIKDYNKLNHMEGINFSFKEDSIKITKEYDVNQIIILNYDGSIDKCIWEDGTTKFTEVLKLGMTMLTFMGSMR